ncbi:MAG TPA: SAM-dependent methyltransferase [Nitrospira sp.]|nr:SAM-dependent methyltransferase [Nitrospira sp.]
MLQDADALPQLIGDYKSVDQWQVHVNRLFYKFRSDQIRNYYQTFASADYRLAHALASDYFEKVLKRDTSPSRAVKDSSPLTVMEWGPGNGNLAACFLSHLRTLDKQERVYPRIRYVMVDWEQSLLDRAIASPALVQHRDRIAPICTTVDRISDIADGTVDRIICNELWNDLPTKLMCRQGGDIEEEFLRPNLSDALHAKIDDWAAFVRAFDAKDVETLRRFPLFFDDLVWEREYRTIDWKEIPYRKTITEFLRRIDEQVVVPVNIGAFMALKEAKRLLSPDAIGFSSFDAGSTDLKVLNDPDKPCSGQFGGQQSYMVNFPLAEAVGKQLGAGQVTVESQREFIGRSLGTNVLTLMDLLATHPSAGTKMEPWEQDLLLLKTVRALDDVYQSPYERKMEFPLRVDTPAVERDGMQALVDGLKATGVPDTVAYLTEEELTAASRNLEEIGYDPHSFLIALTAPPSPVDYFHLLMSR